MKTKSKATDDDAKIGLKVKKLRILKGLTQEALAIELDMSFQQIQKYERGLNRISAVNLQKISKILDVPITAFFEKADLIDHLKLDRQTKRLFQVWPNISSKQKDAVLDMIKFLIKNHRS